LYCWSWTDGRLLLHKTLPPTRELWRHEAAMETYPGLPLAWLRDGSAWVVNGHLLLDRESGEIDGVLPPSKKNFARLPLDRETFIGLTLRDEDAKLSLKVQEVPPEQLLLASTKTAGPPDEGQPPAEYPPSESSSAPSDPADPSTPSVAATKPPVSAPPVKPPVTTPAPPDVPPDFHRSPNALSIPMRQRLERAKKADQTYVDWQVKPDPPAEPPRIHRSKSSPVTLPYFEHLIFPDRPSDFVMVCDHSDRAEPVVVNLVTGKESGRLPVQERIEFNLRALSPDGRYFAGMVKSDRRNVRVWDCQTGQVVLQIGNQGVDLKELDFSVAGHLVTLIESDTEMNIEVWSLAEGKPVRRLAAPRINQSWVVIAQDRFAVSPGGRYAAVVFDGLLFVFDLFEGRLSGRGKVPFQCAMSGGSFDMGCLALEFSADGTRLAAYIQMAGGGTQLVCWDMATGHVDLWRWPRHLTGADTQLDKETTLLRWFPDEAAFFVDREYVVDGETGAFVWRVPNDQFDAVVPIGLNRMLVTKRVDDHHQLLTVAGTRSGFSAVLKAARAAVSESTPPLADADWNGASRLDLPAELPAWSYQPDPAPPAPTAVQTHITLEKADVLNQVQAARLARRDLGVAVVHNRITYTQHPTGVSSGPMRPRQLRWLEVIDLATGEMTGKVPLPAWYELLDISPDASLVLTGWTNNRALGYYRVDVWSPETGQHVVGNSPEEDHSVLRNGRIRFAAFVDQQHILTETTSGMALWSIPDCRARYVVRDCGYLRAISPDRRYVVSYHETRGLLVYQTSDGRCCGSVTMPLEGLSSIAVRRAAFHPDGQKLAVLVSRHDGEVFVLVDLVQGVVTSTVKTPQARLINRLEWLSDRTLLGFSHFRSHSRNQMYLIDLDESALIGPYKLYPGAVTGSACDGRCWYAHDFGGATQELYRVRALTATELKAIEPSGKNKETLLPVD